MVLPLALTISDIALWEIHEAFAAQILANVAAITDAEWVRTTAEAVAAMGEFDWDRVKPNGGSVALGHPFAAAGARDLSQAVKELWAMPAGSRAIVRVCADGGHPMRLPLQPWERSISQCQARPCVHPHPRIVGRRRRVFLTVLVRVGFGHIATTDGKDARSAELRDEGLLSAPNFTAARFFGGTYDASRSALPVRAALANGLSIVETPENVTVEYVNGEHIHESEYIAPRGRYRADRSWTTTRELPCRRTRIMPIRPTSARRRGWVRRFVQLISMWSRIAPYSSIRPFLDWDDIREGCALARKAIGVVSDRPAKEPAQLHIHGVIG